MIKLAKIIDIDTEKVVLELDDNKQCHDCKSRCSDGFLNFLFHKKDKGAIFVSRKVNQLDNCHLIDKDDFFLKRTKSNEKIGLQFDEKDFFKLSLFLYALPILSIIFSLILGYYSFQQLGLNSDLGGFLGLFMGLFVAKSIIKNKQKTFIPTVKFFQ